MTDLSLMSRPCCMRSANAMSSASLHSLKFCPSGMLTLRRGAMSSPDSLLGVPVTQDGGHKQMAKLSTLQM